MKLGCAAALAQGDTYTEKLAYLERLGFDGIEIILRPPDLAPEQLDSLEQALSSSPIEVCCLIVSSTGLPHPITSQDIKQQKLVNAKIAIELGARLGGVVMATPEYMPQNPLPLFNRPAPLTDLERELLFSYLGEIAEMAERHAVIVGLEPINRYETHYYHTLGDVMAICDQLGSPRLKIIADFFHMSIEERDIASSLTQAAGYICHVQLGDSNRELPGLGHTDFQPGFAALQRTGYNGYLSLECRLPEDPHRQMPACVDHLRALLARF